MWTGQEMTLADGLMISAVGLLVVFAALAALAIAVIIISKIIVPGDDRIWYDDRRYACNI